MDATDRMILAVSLTAIMAVVGGFVFWGPSPSPRNKRKGTVVGLQNLGLTCYLNSLLQALACCSYFMEWLNNQRNEGNVAIEARKLLNILCGKTQLSDNVDVMSPVDLMNALHTGGWKITMNTQQDVHELLCNFIAILEEEAHKTCVDLMIIVNDMKEADDKSNLGNSSKFGISGMEQNANGLQCSNADIGNHCSISKRFQAHDLSQNPKPSPFRGYLTDRIECTLCNYKSVLRYEKFENISLNLPDVYQPRNVYTLRNLLNNFVNYEIIQGITCESCNENRPPSSPVLTSPAVKLLRFGKLPPCLCLHIARTLYHELGVYKRQDFVEFPEYIAMDPFIYKPGKESTFTRSESANSQDGDENDDKTKVQNGEICNIGEGNKYIYRLKAVIVHRGSHNDGHFMTYRRGTGASETQHRCSDASRWYLVSDAEVKETTLCNVLSCIAYVLFYEKCSNV